MKSKIFLLLLAFLVTSCHEKTWSWQTGDLVFVKGQVSGDLDRAIMGSTGAMVHVGMVEVVHDSIFIIDAAPMTGVSRRPLEVFLEAQKDENGQTPEIKVMRLKDNYDAAGFVAQAKSLCGSAYDFSFLPDNDRYYCSELVYACYQRNGEPIFEAQPMNFRNADGGFDDYWVELFAKQGMDIPQGVLGTNPDDLSHSQHLVPKK